jgi:hypothetical protein
MCLDGSGPSRDKLVAELPAIHVWDANVTDCVTIVGGASGILSRASDAECVGPGLTGLSRLTG